MADLSNPAKYLREEITEEGRYYFDTDNVSYPSVTTLLSKYEDKTTLENWRLKIGDEAADKRCEESALRGTIAHSAVEHYLDQSDPNPTDPYATIAIEHFYSKIKPVKAEEAIFYQDPLSQIRYAGRFDSLVEVPPDTFDSPTGMVPGGQYIIDLKTKDNLPNPYSAKMTLKNYLQGAAYIHGHEYMFGTKPDGFILVYVSKKACRVCLLNSKSMDYHWRLFRDIALDFYNVRRLKMTWSQMESDCERNWDFENDRFISYLPQIIEPV